MKWIGIVVATATLLVVAACGGGSDKPEKASPSKPSATAATENVPRVSEATFCRIAFGEGSGPLKRAADVVRKFANDPDPTELDETKLKNLKAELNSLEERAPKRLEPHVGVESATIQTLIDAAEDPQSGQDISFETFKSSGLEIAVTCGG